MSVGRLNVLPFIDELSPSGRERLFGAAQVVKLKEFSPVIARGDDVSGVYVVLDGALRIYYVNREGREGTLYWVDPGQSCILALNCLFAKIAYPAWVETDQSGAEVAIIAGDVYRELYLCEPSLQKFTFANLSERLFELMALLQESASFGLEQRVAAYLLRRAQNSSVLQVTHEQVAHHLSSSREVVSRVLRNVARRGAIELTPGQIRIIDRDELEALVDAVR